MDQDEIKNLRDSLSKRVVEIDKELNSIATENPLIKGDFNVKVEDIGQSQEDAAQEAGELDRQQALVNALEAERKNITATLEKIDSGTYGKCTRCSSDIGSSRLRAMPIAMFCIECAKKSHL